MRDISLCHPRLQKLAAELISKCAAKGLQIKIGETLRTKAEQDALYAQGRTTPGNIVTNAPGSSYSSYHQWGKKTL
jgi:peptidoglycan L-alanyl-D-glutamate endopeptidase CwlK